MELFDKRFVHFMWDDALKGKRCFVSDYIDSLKEYVEHDESGMCLEVTGEGTDNYPFEVLHANGNSHSTYQFVFYDPNYEVKKAFNEGKKVQVYDTVADDWVDCDEPLWCLSNKYRIKPEEEKWIAYLVRKTNGSCYLSACAESCWKAVQKEFGAKTKLFVGTESEVNEWFESRQKFAEVIKAWEDGKQIQFLEDGKKIQFLDYGQWEDCRGKPLWCLTNVYREKPECPCDAGIDSKACVGCPQSEDGKKKWRPYKDSAEMIADFIARFKVKCPPYAEPSVWVKGKNTGTKFLIFAFYETFIKFNDDEPAMFDELSDCYTYLDGSPCGMEVKE